MMQKSTQYSFKFSKDTVMTVLFMCFMVFSGLFSTASASIPSQNPVDSCQIRVQQIEVAKGNLNQPMQKPTDGWIRLEKLPDRWEKRWPDFHDMAWYKVQFDYACKDPTQAPLSFALENITQSGRIFINDALLWSDLSLQEPASRSQYMPRQWNIASSSLKEGRNILWIQVYGSLTQKSGLGRLEMGINQHVYPIYKNWVLEKRTLAIFNVMICFVVGIFYFLAWFTNREERSFFWYGIINFCWILYSTCYLLSDPLLFSTTTLDRIQNIIFCFYTVAGCIAAWTFVHLSFDRLEKVLWIFFLCASVCLSLSPLPQLNSVIQIFFAIAMLIFLAKCICFPFLAYRSKLPESYLMAGVYLIFIPIALHDAHFVITMEGHPLSPYTGPFTTLALGAVLALRLARNSRQIKQFNKTLSENVYRARAELTESLEKQHQLALENVRLQERIHLSHDLHDGLGGSIVRSMLTLEHNEKIEKPQVMSILKLLRNDLRQVIDSGSSLTSKIPATPVEWAAPIRHRFVQLFEETDIRSKWHFEQQWQTQPSALYCITLTRIAEEALTNILKHSKATQVYVTLRENENGWLVLQIEDNGIGFSPAEVDSGLHVGLQSMRARIERIGGQFQVESQPGRTVIEVMLPFIPDIQQT
ncbi:ATP-binding protein [Acinetobacter chinensis]|uniref:histidine kinase n=1 Tax=Acinetobacter chinensis TaxID=2004650 RepID=A0ABU3WCK3_9GAMM|nr:ATP-binding protein [Acinetobacter chinensis]MDV2468140.1 ATP-binding protein [Acinetobacter chinensis]